MDDDIYGATHLKSITLSYRNRLVMSHHNNTGNKHDMLFIAMACPKSLKNLLAYRRPINCTRSVVCYSVFYDKNAVNVVEIIIMGWQQQQQRRNEKFVQAKIQKKETECV